MMTKGQADATATLVATLRPDWDVRGILAALAIAKDRGSAADVAVAAIRAASVPSNRTPAVIPLAGPHWPTTTTGPADGPWDRRPCHRCRNVHDADTTCARRNAEGAERGANLARALLAAAKTQNTITADDQEAPESPPAAPEPRDGTSARIPGTPGASTGRTGPEEP